MGCDSSGFFSLFSGQSAQCGPVNNQIQQMRANLDQITTNLERLRSGGLGGADRDNQRRSVLLALAQNNCGPQYANAARGPGNFLHNLFGNNNPNNNPAQPGADLGPQSGTFRTVCVRTCDGNYFPISFATVPARFPDDERTCRALCPATEANLYTYRNPGEDMNPAVSINGQAYSSSRTLSLSPGVQSVLLLQGRRPDLVRCAEKHRRQGRRRTARRHHRHRRERQEDGAARRRKAPRRPSKKGGAGTTGHAPALRRRTRRRLQRLSRRARRQTDPHRSVRLSSPRAEAFQGRVWNRLFFEAFRRSAACARQQHGVGLGQRLAGVAKLLVIG